MNVVSIESLRKKFSYDPSTGEVRRLVSAGNCKAGAVLSKPNQCGYITVSVDGHICQGHRIAWAMHYGSWPANTIDHINGIKTDNRIENLRDVTAAVNKQNMRAARSDSRSGLIGAIWQEDRKSWKAEIAVGGKKKMLGRFKTAEAAHEAYVLAKRTVHEGCTL